MGLFAYAGVSDPDGREMIQVELTSPLQAGVRYLVEYHVSLADKFQYAVGSFGALLTDTLFIRETPYIDGLDLDPQIQSPPGLIFDDKDGWMAVRDTFRSRYGGERFITIGNFKLDVDSDTIHTGTGDRKSSYYYVDDVSVTALDTLTGIAEAQRLRLHVHPNPSSGSFAVRASSPWGSGGMLILHDAQGRAVLHQRLRAGQHSATVGTEGLAVGVYTLRLQLDDGSSGWEKVVVQ